MYYQLNEILFDEISFTTFELGETSGSVSSWHELHSADPDSISDPYH